MTPQTYLAATDLSSTSRFAASVGARIAEQTGAHIELYCAVPQAEQGLSADMLQSVRSHLERLSRRLERQGVVSHWRARVVRAVPESVARAARSRSAELVIVGPRGAGEGHSMALGRVTEALLRKPIERILVGRRSAGDLRRILVAVDRRTGSAAALRAALVLAQALKARVLIVEAVPRSSDALALDPAAGSGDAGVDSDARPAALRRLRKWLQAYPVEGLTIDSEVLMGSVPSAICDRARMWGAGIVVVGAVGAAARRAGRLGRVSRQVAERCPASVLVVRQRPTRRPVVTVLTDEVDASRRQPSRPARRRTRKKAPAARRKTAKA